MNLKKTRSIWLQNAIIGHGACNYRGSPGNFNSPPSLRQSHRSPKISRDGEEEVWGLSSDLVLCLSEFDNILLCILHFEYSNSSPHFHNQPSQKHRATVWCIGNTHEARLIRPAVSVATLIMEGAQNEVEEIYASLKDQPPHTAEQIERIKKLIYLYEVTFIHENHEETRKLVHPDYKQHDPLVGDGASSIIEFHETMKKKMAEDAAAIGKAVNLQFSWKRVFVDGDILIAQILSTRWDGDLGLSVIDIFRYQDGQFIEHWDAIQEVPPFSNNSNGLF